MTVVYLNKILFFLYSLLLLITPLLVFPFTSELFEFNKIIFIYLITTLTVFIWLLKMILYKKIILKKTPFDIFFLLFFISQLLSTFFSIDRHTSVYGYYGRFNGGLLSLLTYLALYYGFVSNFSKDQIEKILKLSLISAVLTVLIGLPGKLNRDLLCLVFTKEWSNSCWTEQFKPAERMFSTLGQPNWFGAYLSVNFFIALYFYFKQDNRLSLLKNISLFFLSGIIFLGILFSRSRSAILSVMTLIPLVLIILLISKKINIKKLIAYLFLIFILIIIFKTGINQIDRYLNFKRSEIVNIKTKTKPSQPNILVTESLDIRKIVWQGAIELGKKYPFFGTGVETFGYSYYFTRPKEHNLTSEWDYLYNRAHNEYLNLFATTGVVGLGTYLLMIATIIFLSIWYLIRNLKEKREEESSFLTVFLLLGYLSILMTNFFGFSTTTISLFFYLIPAIIFVINKDQSLEKTELIKSDERNLIYILILIIIFSFIIIKIINYWRADRNYAQAESYNKLGYYQHAANSLNQALKLKYEHVYEDKLSNNLAILALVAANQNEKQLIKKLISTSIFFNDKSLQASPKNILYLKTKAKNSYLYYQALLDKQYLNQGIKALILAHQYAPTEPKILYNLAIFYNLLSEVEKKNKDEQKELLEKSIKYINLATNLKPNYRDAIFFKAQLLKKIGKNDEAKTLLNFILEKIEPQDREVKEELEGINNN